MRNRKLILVIENEEVVASVLKDALNQMEYDVLIANSGVEALSRIKTSRPDLITLELMMPGLNGIKILKNLKSNAHTKDIPVILLSVADDPSRYEALQLGAIAFLEKPLDFNRLNKIIRSVTEKKTVLVVDDDEMVLRVVEKQLMYLGYKVICVSDWENAIMKTREEKPAVILMDYWLPEKDGFEVTRKLKQDPETANIPVIAFSGTVTETLDNKEILGVDKFLGRKFLAEDLAGEVDAFLKSKSL